jgi:RecG-like helicase
MALLRRKRDDQPPEAVPAPNSIPMCDAAPRQRVCVAGKVVRMTARPTSGQPALAVSVSDDTATVTAVWTGRREIGGVTLGRRIAISGVPVKRGDHLEFTNPDYTLLPR